jgi:hypothetical protein
VLERTLPFEVSESAFSVVIPAIEMAFGNAGQVGHAGQTFTWHANNRNSGRSQQLRIIVRGGGTSIRIEESYGSMIGGLFGGVLGGVGGGVGLGAVPAIGLALHSTILAVGLPALFIGGLYGGLRYGFRGYVQKRRRALEHLLHDMSETLRAQTPAITK